MENQENQESKGWYDRNYKKLLLIPLILLVLSIGYQVYFYNQNQDFIKKDISLTGGTSITIFSETLNIQEVNSKLSDKIPEFSTRQISDFRTGHQQAIVIESTSEVETLKKIIEDNLNINLTNENSSIESTGSTLGDSFYHQLLFAIILSFALMALVVLFLFGPNFKVKLLFTIITLIPIILFFSSLLSVNIAILITTGILIGMVLFYIKYSVPSAAVVISAFADIIMTLALVNFLGMKVSSAGIIAFLMLIGYSVDTDIMLTTRLLKNRESINKKLKEAFKTGLTMTLTSILAIAAAFIITQSFSEVLKQIFSILLIGLSFDILNTWITNASILKWYLEAKR